MFQEQADFDAVPREAERAMWQVHRWAENKSQGKLKAAGRVSVSFLSTMRNHW